MSRRGCGIGVIIDGLVVNRQGIITESAEDKVQKDIKTLLSNHDISRADKRKIYTLLDIVYSKCNDAGPYKLTNESTKKVDRNVDDEDYYNPTVEPALDTVSYDIKFLAAVDVKSLYDSIYSEFKTLKSKLAEVYIDQFAISVEFEEEGSNGLYLAVEKISKGFHIDVGYLSYDVGEASTGLCGTEIGLPIDKENCESTGIGGISTPTGGFTDEKKKKKLISAIDEASEETEELDTEETEDSKEKSSDKEKKSKDSKKEESETKEEPYYDTDGVERLRCPECDSPNVNSDGTTLTCSDCSYTWTLGKDEEDEIKDNMLPDEDDISSDEYEDSKLSNTTGSNEVECIETQQNTPKEL